MGNWHLKNNPVVEYTVNSSRHAKTHSQLGAEYLAGYEVVYSQDD